MTIAAISRELEACRRGAAAVEFGLVLPIVLTAIFGIIEGGRLIYTQTALHFAAQEATRYAVVREGQVSDSDVSDYTEGRLMGLKRELAVVTVESPIDPEIQTQKYTVEVAYDFTPLLPYTGNDTIRLTARSSGFVAFAPQNPGGN